jgi:adenylosuccinate lyase
MGFDRIIPVSGQTYTRKQDIRIFSVLSSLGASAHKIATDIRLLSHLKELSEPFGEMQVGSSAMPYKKNPIRSERVCGLARFLLSLNENPLYTASTQWLERSLDDSANRRLCIPEAFLCADAILNLLIYIVAGLKLYPTMIRKNMLEELPFMAIEHILMYVSAKKGKDRQALHERLRLHSLKAQEEAKEKGAGSELLEMILADPLFDLSREELNSIMKEDHFTGRASEQTKEFLHDEVHPILKKHQNISIYKPLVFV